MSSLRERNFSGYAMEARTSESRAAFEREFERNQERRRQELQEQERKRNDPNTIVGRCNCDCEGCRYKNEHCGTGTMLMLGSDGGFLSGCRARRQGEPELPTIHKHGDFTRYDEPCKCAKCRKGDY